MNLDEARRLAEETCSCKTEKGFSLETEWGYVFRLNEAESDKLPIIFVDVEREKVIRTRANELDKRIEVYTKDREEFGSV